MQPAENEILSISSSLPLQVALYFNVLYSPFWFFAHVMCLHLKYAALTQLYKILSIVVLGVFGIVEVSRLYFGYLGNLSEKVPELASFWLLTLLIQLPLNLLLLFNSAFLIVPLECAMDLIMALFVCFEIIAGYFAIQGISQQHEYLFQRHIKSSGF